MTLKLIFQRSDLTNQENCHMKNFLHGLKQKHYLNVNHNVGKKIQIVREAYLIILVQCDDIK